MKIERIKYKRTTPKSQIEFSKQTLSMSGGFGRLLKTVAKIIEKYFGLLYVNMSKNVFI